MNIIKKILFELQYLRKSVKHNEKQSLLQGKILSQLNMQKKEDVLKDIHLSEFSVFSQWGDDGIIDFLVNYLEIVEEKFVEFGVGDYTESNTRFLLMNKNWEGLVIDGSKNYIQKIQAQEIYWKYSLKAINSFVTQKNINNLLIDNEFSGEIGLLHIDIDGNDYWIWKAIDCIQPIIVIIEYNSFFGKEKAYTIPYQDNFNRFDDPLSCNVFWGASITSLNDLAIEKGYSFVGCNSNGNNAYFIRNDKIKSIKIKSISEGFVLAKFREARDEKGNLTFLKTNPKTLKGYSVFNTRENKTELVK